MTPPTHLPLPLAKRATLVLAAATAIGGAASPVAIGLGGLIGASLLPADGQALATLPITTFIIGSAVASIPAALSMRRVGRRAGFVAGAGIGAVGVLAAILGILAASFWLFLVAMLIMGASNAFRQQYRFAAADASEPAFKPKAISWVLAGGIFTGVLGPQISIHGRGLWPAAPFVGPFVLVLVLTVGSALLLARLRVPAPAPLIKGGGGRPLATILLSPRFMVAQLAAIASYALMSLVMTASPLAMVAHHHDHEHAQLAIQWHVIAMYAPSFVTGAIIARLGKAQVAALGLVLIAVAAAISMLGTALGHFYLALILLGVGWNFGFVAATAMVSELYRPEEAFRVQAVSEFVLFGIVAVASFSSGKILARSGWEAVNHVVFPVVAVTLILIAAQAVIARRRLQPT